MTIAFIHSKQSFLPGLSAYKQHFASLGINTLECYPGQKTSCPVDVEWHFMGFHGKRQGKALTVHEYASSSTPPLARAKDQIKRFYNIRPDFRIFSCSYVQRQFAFNDPVPSGIRASGVWASSLNNPTWSEPKEFDFIYVGSVANNRRIDLLIRSFLEGPLREKKILVLSKDYRALQRATKQVNNIQFAGPLPIQEVYRLIAKSRFAINFIPDLEPFNQQPSTKFLEYAACQIPILTTDYPWIRQFESLYGGRYYYLKNDLSNLQWNEIIHFPFSFPDLETWTWEYQINQCGIMDFFKGIGLLPSPRPD